jgi:hypothetical protein
MVSGRRRILFAGLVLLAWAGLLLVVLRRGSDLQKDELHFWPTSLLFSRSLVPDIDTLRNYNELSTPLPFMVFGAVEHLFGWGVTGGRLVNWLASLIVILLIGMPRRDGAWRPCLAAVGLMLCPYFVGASVYLYTDMLAILFVCLGVWFYLRSRHWLSALAFILAIAARQYMIAFPAAILCYELCASWKRGFAVRGSWVAPAVAAASILGWIALFGGLAPRAAVDAQQVSTARAARIFPDHGLYFLACLAVYFVIPEAILYRDWRPDLKRWRTAAACALLLILLFAAFPPLANVEYPIPAMGFFDVAVRRVLPDFWRMALFCACAWICCLRFMRTGLAGVLVGMNALVMLKAHVGWDKYALPLLAVLWLLKSEQRLDPSGSLFSAHSG